MADLSIVCPVCQESLTVSVAPGWTIGFRTMPQVVTEPTLVFTHEVDGGVVHMKLDMLTTGDIFEKSTTESFKP